jgi:hypothetical protein
MSRQKTKAKGSSLALSVCVIEEPADTIVEAAVPMVRIPTEPDDAQTLRLIECSGSLDFWNRPEEDGYTADDGEPL